MVRSPLWRRYCPCKAVDYIIFLYVQLWSFSCRKWNSDESYKVLHFYGTLSMCYRCLLLQLMKYMKYAPVSIFNPLHNSKYELVCHTYSVRRNNYPFVSKFHFLILLIKRLLKQLIKLFSLTIMNSKIFYTIYKGLNAYN